jgi:hypothetical protein
LRVFENIVLRIIFLPERNEVARGWRRLHNEELHNLHVARMGEIRNAYSIFFFGKPEVKSPLGRHRHKMER